VLLDAIPKGAVLFDVEWRCLAINPAFVSLCGLSEERLIGCLAEELFPGTASDRLGEPPRDQAYRVPGLGNGGAVCTLHWRHLDPPWHEARWVALVQPPTEEQPSWEAFLAALAHELRSPLTTLLLRAQGLVRSFRGASAEGLQPVQSKVEAFERQLAAAIRRLNGLLDASRLLSGKPLLQGEEVNLSDVVRQSVADLRGDFARAGCELRLQVSEAASGRWDRVRIEQVVTNLLGNALKYGAGKPVTVTVEADEAEARLIVSDEGAGLSQEDQTCLFLKFERAASVQAFAGVGLGLWIVGQVLRALGGHIHVASVSGQGSTFTVTLPRVPGQESEQRNVKGT
jgi:signal transduction histidine kinase